MSPPADSTSAHFSDSRFAGSLQLDHKIDAATGVASINESLRPDSGGVINMLRSSQQCTWAVVADPGNFRGSHPRVPRSGTSCGHLRAIAMCIRAVIHVCRLISARAAVELRRSGRVASEPSRTDANARTCLSYAVPRSVCQSARSNGNTGSSEIARERFTA